MTFSLVLFVGIFSSLVSVSTASCAGACQILVTRWPENTYFGPVDLWSKFQAEVIPSCRVQPSNTVEVAEILAVVREQNCHFAVLAGGTAPFRYASNADQGITIDMQKMKTMELIDSDTLMRVGAGALWADVYRELNPRNLSATGTRNSLTGVTGSILGGGISFFSQKFGWACDTVTEFEVILANSSIIRVSEISHPDLFFALRGGGNNFGIVTEVTIEVFQNPPSWYAFQLWDQEILGVIFERLEAYTAQMPPGIWQLATTLGWNPYWKDFVISERIVASELPDLPGSLKFPGDLFSNRVSGPLSTYVYQRSTLEMTQKMDYMNPPGFYNYFGSVTVKNNAKAHLALADEFFNEITKISHVSDLQAFIVYNPLTKEALEHMRKRGGNALGINVQDGPLTIVNINIHWSQSADTPLMTDFMSRLISRFRQRAQGMHQLHPYIFQNHAFEQQDVFNGYGSENLERLRRIRRDVDKDGVFQKLQPGFFKLN